jgi:hypothetical protein
MCIFSHTKKFSWLWRNLCAIIANWCFWLLFFICIYHIIYDINGQNLIVFENDILMFKNLWVFLLIIEIDWFKTIWTRYGIVNKLILIVAIRFTNWNFVHNAAHLFLCVFDLIETHIEDHAHLWEFIPFLANFEYFVVLV